MVKILKDEPLLPEDWYWPDDLAARENSVTGSEFRNTFPRAALYVPPPGRPEMRRRRIQRAVSAIGTVVLVLSLALLIVAAMAEIGVD